MVPGADAPAQAQATTVQSPALVVTRMNLGPGVPLRPATKVATLKGHHAAADLALAAHHALADMETAHHAAAGRALAARRPAVIAMARTGPA